MAVALILGLLRGSEVAGGGDRGRLLASLVGVAWLGVAVDCPAGMVEVEFDVELWEGDGFPRSFAPLRVAGENGPPRAMLFLGLLVAVGVDEIDGG